MKTVAEIRNTDDMTSKKFCEHKTDRQITAIATTKEISDAFSMISNIQEGLAGNFISAETAIEQMNHVKQHLLNGMDAIDGDNAPQDSYRRDTMFINGFMCSCND